MTSREQTEAGLLRNRSFAQAGPLDGLHGPNFRCFESSIGKQRSRDAPIVARG